MPTECRAQHIIRREKLVGRAKCSGVRVIRADAAHADRRRAGMRVVIIAIGARRRVTERSAGTLKDVSGVFDVISYRNA